MYQSRQNSFISSGKFDNNTFFAELGLDAQQASNINISLTSYKTMRDKLTDSITDGVDFAKSLL